MKIVEAACSLVQVCDPDGNVLATVDPYHAMSLGKDADCSDGRRYTGEQVRNHLLALERAWLREGPFDEVRMRKILDEIRAADTP